MGKMTRRVRWILLVVVLLLAAAGAWVYFVGKEAILEHAEAFAFRRMSVPAAAEDSSFEFFYTTNRVVENPDDEPQERYGSERSTTLQFGHYETRIEPTVGLGMLLNPSDWFMNEEIQLRKVQDMAEQEWIARLRSQVESSPYRSLLVVVHGFREAFPSALRKTAFLAHVLDINTPVLVFDWPGNQGSSLRGYRQARQVAEASGQELAATLELIIEQVAPERLWLLANSMGGQVVADGFEILNRDTDFSDRQTEIEDVVLTAPDVDHDEFNERFLQEIEALTDDLTVYVSSNDRALLVSRLINRGRRLGESTLDPRRPEQFGEASRLADLIEPDDDDLALVDVTPVNRTRNFHNFSLETPEFFDDLFLRLTNEETPNSRRLYVIRSPEGVRYYVLTRGR